jgi:hypothetical protein
VSETVALPDADARAPVAVCTTAVTTSVWLAPALPVNVPTNEQLYEALDGRAAPTPQVPRPERSPYTLSVSDTSVTGWVPVLVTVTPNVNVPPGAGRVDGDAVLETVAAGDPPATVTV